MLHLLNIFFTNLTLFYKFYTKFKKLKKQFTAQYSAVTVRRHTFADEEISLQLNQSLRGSGLCNRGNRLTTQPVIARNEAKRSGEAIAVKVLWVEY